MVLLVPMLHPGMKVSNKNNLKINPFSKVDEETKQRLFNEALTDLLENDYEVKMQLRHIVQYLSSEKFCDCKNNFF